VNTQCFFYVRRGKVLVRFLLASFCSNCIFSGSQMLTIRQVPRGCWDLHVLQIFYKTEWSQSFIQRKNVTMFNARDRLSSLLWKREYWTSSVEEKNLRLHYDAVRLHVKRNGCAYFHFTLKEMDAHIFTASSWLALQYLVIFPFYKWQYLGEKFVFKAAKTVDLSPQDYKSLTESISDSQQKKYLKEIH
jgi:hypothetical protein